MVTRINYGAVISEIITATHLSKSALSVSHTSSFIAYGAGQILSSMCGDNFSSKKLVSYGLIVKTLMNILISFCQNQYLLLIVWSINGFA